MAKRISFWLDYVGIYASTHWEILHPYVRTHASRIYTYACNTKSRLLSQWYIYGRSFELSRHFGASLAQSPMLRQVRVRAKVLDLSGNSIALLSPSHFTVFCCVVCLTPHIRAADVFPFSGCPNTLALARVDPLSSWPTSNCMEHNICIPARSPLEKPHVWAHRYNYAGTYYMCYGSSDKRCAAQTPPSGNVHEYYFLLIS
jgi:hypothetical protein